MTNPRITHLMDQLGVELRDLATIIGAYRTRLEEQGVPPEEAEALALRLEERLLGPLLEGDEAVDHDM